MRVALFGAEGKVGRVVHAALEDEGYDVRPVDFRRGDELADDVDAAVDFTTPGAAEANVRAVLERGVPCVVGTTGWAPEPLAEVAAKNAVALFYAPNFAVGAVLMMRFAAEAARYFAKAEIVELHNEAKRDAPSGTAKATAERVGGDVPIHSVRLPGLLAHQEVLLGGDGQLLTIRHDTTSREAFVPGVLLALERLHTLPPGLTVGLEALLDRQ